MKNLSILFLFLEFTIFSRSLKTFHYRRNQPIRKPTFIGENNGGSDGPPNDTSLLCSKSENESSTSRNIQSFNPLIKQFSSLSEETKDDIKSTIISFAIAIFVRVVLLEPRLITYIDKPCFIDYL
jgi:hypothetical protein